MEKIKFYTKPTISSTPELKMVIDVSGNVGIGEPNPTKTLEVVGDISFNGDLYQNGTQFQGGTLVNETTDISLNNLNVHGDISLNGNLYQNGELFSTGVWDSSNSNIYYNNFIQSNTSILNTPVQLLSVQGYTTYHYNGTSVSLNGDGSIFATGEPQHSSYNYGRVRVYQNVNNNWTQLGSDITGSSRDDKLGNIVSLSEDGTRLAASTYKVTGGYASVYQYSGSSWSQLGSDITSGDSTDYFGDGMAFSSDGTTIAVGSNYYNSGLGKTRVYRYSNSSWTQLGSDIDGASTSPDGRFGAFLALNNDGTMVACSALERDINNGGGGYIVVYQYSSGIWNNIGSWDDLPNEAASLSFSNTNNILAFGIPSTTNNGLQSNGSTYVYQYLNNTWTQIGNTIYGVYADIYLGSSVSLNNDGTTIAIGAESLNNSSYTSYTFIYKYYNNLWNLEKTIQSPFSNDTDLFGCSVSLSKNGLFLAIGAERAGSYDQGTSLVYQVQETIDEYGKVGIATSSPQYTLHVNGNVAGTSGFVNTSDDRVKHNEQPITNALSTISKITPKHYFKTGSTLYDPSHNFLLNSQNQPLSTLGTPLILNKDYTLETGIIAQEIQTIPELEFTIQNTTPLGVDYNSIHCTHIAATKELHQLVESQQTTIQSQQQEITNLKQENQTLIQRLQTIEQHLGI